jgi:uncharacterized protein
MAWQGNGMACVNQTRPHCVNQMGNTQSKALVERHGRGIAGEQHGNGMVCVNPPLDRRLTVDEVADRLQIIKNDIVSFLFLLK